jgi:creatinine amidohydrolase/Fe(II)-dependent formamide hydrolase-like protein
VLFAHEMKTDKSSEQSIKSADEMRPREILEAIKNRIKALESSGIKHVFLINHHGGRGQFKTVEKVAEETTSDLMKVHALRTYR